ncbi:MAG TPA: DUF6603 domain-containing protein [Gemmatimonadaceae bacterium]
MSATTAQDTLSRVAIELATIVEPLRSGVVPPNTVGFFAQLGTPLTPAEATALGAPLDTIATQTGALVDLIPDLVTALEAEDWGTVASKGLEATVDVAQIIAAFDDLATAAQGLALPDAAQLAERLVNYLLGKYLDAIQGLNDVLEFLGFLDRQDFNVDSTDPANPPYTIYSYDFGVVGEWLSDPAAKAQAIYGWGAGFDGQLLFPKLEKLLAFAGIPVIYDDTTTPRTLDVVVIEMKPTTSGVPGLAIGLKSDIGSGPVSVPLGPDATLEFDVEFDIPTGMQLVIGTDGSLTFTPPSVSTVSGAFSVKLILERNPPEPFILFGVGGGSRIEFGDFTLAALAHLTMSGSSATGDLDVSGTLNDGKVVIDATKGDGFLGKILPGTRIEADFSVVMGISTERGFYFSGSSALEVRLPVHIEIGPISIVGLTLTGGLQGGDIPMSVGADIQAKLGPIQAVVQNMGVTATLSFPPHNSGNLGAAQLDIGFKPPNGVGLSVQAGPITGGGFLSFDDIKGEYIGALELSFKGLFALKAIGIINTKMPDGTPGFALLLLVTAEFTPIQLGYGFVLIGVGGLLGLNRSLDAEALRLGVRTGGVSSVLFPPDVIGNIVQIVSDLKAFFPIVQGHFVVAPMGKLGWGTPALITLELGIILDIPAPQLTIIGVLRCILPREEAPILKLQVNFAGGIDFAQGLIWFDASLFDSSLVVFTLSGDMALRIGWGAEKIFVISVGGFHPNFHEVPSDLTGMKRMTIALLSGDNPRLTAQTYFAVTSNTVQSGARVELYAAAGSFNIYGFLGYDLLVQLLPLHFVADIEAGLALRKGSSVIAGVSVSCELSGPTPWHAKGKASLDLWLFSITVGFDETWGDPLLAIAEELVDVLGLLVAAVNDGRNWTAEMPPNAQQTVSLRQVDPPQDSLLLHPFGVLVVSQKITPLAMAIDKFGTQKPTGDTTFAITWDGGSSDTAREEFAIANFVTMSDSEKLARKSFEAMPSGLRFTSGDSATTGVSTDRDVTYEMSYVHRKVTKPGGRVGILKSLFDQLSRGGAIASNPLSVSARKAGGNGPAAIDVAQGGYQVVNVSDLSPAAPNATASTQAEAYAIHDALVRGDPSLAGNIQVMAAHELASAA